MSKYPDGRRRGAGGSKNYSVYQPNTSTRNPSPANGKAGTSPEAQRQEAFRNPANPNTPQGGKGGFKPNAVGGYVAPEQTYTGHTSSVKGADGYYGVGGGDKNKLPSRPDATSIIARPDLQKASAPIQLATAAPSNFAARTPLTNLNTNKTGKAATAKPSAPESVPNAIRAPAAPTGGQ